MEKSETISRASVELTTFRKALEPLHRAGYQDLRCWGCGDGSVEEPSVWKYLKRGSSIPPPAFQDPPVSSRTCSHLWNAHPLSEYFHIHGSAHPHTAGFRDDVILRKESLSRDSKEERAQDTAKEYFRQRG
ncbi:hypothetical protein H920_07349 [Fukomys damarensis]|uniref:Uncharacterized protein n=1 Tax=Fukomys damarensis TaxID=885580 RepID=A0A091DJK4_FUKDA|nr:hypothetical protein H920_07349 [Fukomys damarensis]